MKCDVNTETHFYAEALTWAAVRYRKQGSPKRMSWFHYAVQNSSQVTSILLTIIFYSLFIQLFIVATTHNMDLNVIVEFLPDAYQHMKIHWVDCCCYSKLNFLLKLYFQMVTGSFRDDARELKQCVTESVHSFWKSLNILIRQWLSLCSKWAAAA